MVEEVAFRARSGAQAIVRFLLWRMAPRGDRGDASGLGHKCGEGPKSCLADAHVKHGSVLPSFNGLGTLTRERGTSEELAGPRCLADLEIHPSQPPRPI